MPTYSFGATGGAGDRPTANTDEAVRYNSSALPTPRIASSGRKPGYITDVSIYCGGNGATRNLRGGVASSDGSGLVNSSYRAVAARTPTTVASFDLAGFGKFFRDTTDALRVRLESNNGSFLFNRNSDGPGSVVDTHGTVFDGSLAGYFTYVQCPTAPRGFTVTPSSDGTSAFLEWDDPSDNGGGSINGYSLQRALNSGFSSGVATATVGASANSATITGLTPGTTYWWRMTAQNPVTDADGANGGTWSTVRSATQPDVGLGRGFFGGSQVPMAGKYYSPSGWVDLDGNVYTGAGWVEIGS